MATEVDPMVALVESWDTFLVQAPPSSSSLSSHPRYHDGRQASRSTPALAETPWTPFSPPPRSFLTDARPPLSLLDDLPSSSSAPPHSVAAARDGAPSLLWLLTLVSRNVELLRAAAHLFLQFNAQFAALVDANASATNSLRERHQQQIASLLEVANSHTTTNMIVDSTVTERMVHQQEQELDSLERECAAAERQLEQQLQETLYTFLSTSAPDAVAAANRRDDTLSWVTGHPSSPVGNSSSSGSYGDGLYRAEVDVSRFAEVRKATPRNTSYQTNSSVSPFAPLRLVPVRTLKLSNEVGNATTNAAISPTRRRSNDVTLQPIILDVSPLSGLTRCLTCCSGTQDGAVASSVSSAAEEHLLRLAHTRHSVLLLIGNEAAALEVLATCKAPELLLGPSHTSHAGFQPLPNHPVLRVLFTTRLWGANVVLLWNPASSATSTAAAATTPTVIEDALELAYAWDADIFTVAVLEGTRLPQTGPAASDAATRAPAASPAAAFFASQAMSMEVLRQLRNGVTRELLETAGVRRARCWQGSTAWLQLGGGAATTAGTHMCPRAVGVLYASQQRAAEAAAAVAAASPVASSSASSPVAAAAAPTFSPTAAFRGPPVTFNTPLAIRAFLPLPEEYFVKARPSDHLSGAAAAAAEGRGGGGGRGNGNGTYSSSMLPSSALRRRVDGSTAPASDLEESTSDEADFAHGSFTSVSSLQRSSRGGFGGPTAAGGGGNRQEPADSYGSATARRNVRQREAMGLEALVHYAFGEFAEAL